MVDIAAWPPGYKPPARLLALDGSGNLLYCQPNEAPTADRLTPPNTEAWGQIKAFTLDLGDSYVLDAPSKGVWIYWRSDFTQEPSMFFNDEIPDMQDVVDMTVNRGDLYLLHADNRLTLCFYSDFQGVPTRCSTPNFVDFRPGRESLPLIPPAPFSQIQNTLPPDPSLYFLEPVNQSVYHFQPAQPGFSAHDCGGKPASRAAMPLPSLLITCKAMYTWRSAIRFSTPYYHNRSASG